MEQRDPLKSGYFSLFCCNSAPRCKGKRQVNNKYCRRLIASHRSHSKTKRLRLLFPPLDQQLRLEVCLKGVLVARQKQNGIFPQNTNVDDVAQQAAATPPHPRWATSSPQSCHTCRHDGSQPDLWTPAKLSYRQVFPAGLSEIRSATMQPFFLVSTHSCFTALFWVWAPARQ